MSDYIYKKYYGKYRILVPIDMQTNDFPRDCNGHIETDDYYIPCRKRGKEIAQISHYKKNILEALVFVPNTAKYVFRVAENEGIPVLDIWEGDDEILFRFESKYIDFFAKNLGAMTQGKNIRPFSIKNLPQSDYEIPSEDLVAYKDIIAGVPKSDSLTIAKATDDFLIKKLQKTLSKEGKTIDQDLRCHKMSRMKKEYIHMCNLWDEYLIFLKHKLRGGDK